MSTNGLSRRNFLGRSIGASLSRAAMRGGWSTALLAASTPAFAKPGGHLAAASHCEATILLNYRGVKQEVTLYLAGAGYASFDNVSDYTGFDLRDEVLQDTVSMQWETSYHFAANRPELGLVRCKTLVRGKSNTRSGIVLVSNNPRGIFPATMINTIFCEMEIPSLGLSMFNKDPIVLRGRVENMTEAMLKADPRVQADPRGVTKEMIALLDPRSQESFNPVGTHALQGKVEFYDKNNPDVRVATNTSAQVRTLPHYGIDVRVSDLSINDRVVTLTWQIQNLLWDSTNPKPQDVVWAVDDSHDFHIISERQGSARLSESPLFLRVQAVNTSRTQTILPVPGAPNPNLLQEACLFCQVQTTPATQDLKDLRSGFAYVDASMMRSRIATAPPR